MKNFVNLSYNKAYFSSCEKSFYEAMSSALSYKIAPRTGLYGSAKCFRVRIHIKCTNEFFTIDGLNGSTTVRELKDKIEDLAGIPG